MSTLTHVLFLCTANSARSILAEALLNHRGTKQFRAFSAGSQPRGVPHPMALAVLSELGIAVEKLRSKSWGEFTGQNAPIIDLVITVCGNAANEACPLWPGAPLRAHWGLPDPARTGESGADVEAAFLQTVAQINARLDALLDFHWQDLSSTQKQTALNQIGMMALQNT